jgi:GR25 family glycosyltransferase involved in LPS biosynthesis
MHWKDDYELQIKNSLTKEIQISKLPTEFNTHYVGYYGYAVSPQGAKKLIKRAQRKGIKSVDRFIENTFIDIKSVTASVVRLDETYIGRVKELSTTAK